MKAKVDLVLQLTHHEDDEYDIAAQEIRAAECKSAGGEAPARSPRRRRCKKAAELVHSLEIECGKGRQSVKWLALTAAERLRSSRTWGAGVSLEARRKAARGLLRPVGIYYKDDLLDPDERVKDLAKRTAGATEPAAASPVTGRENETSAKAKPKVHVRVTLAAQVACSAGGAPMLGSAHWQDRAFGKSPTAMCRLRCAEEEKAARQVARLELEQEGLLQEWQTHFLEALGLDPDGELHVFTKDDDLANTAADDWQRLRKGLEKVLQYDRGELAIVRKAIMLNYRLLRDAFKLYSGLSSDRRCALTFSELMCLLQDAQVCEPQDADLVHRMISPMLAPDGSEKGVAGVGARPASDAQFSRVGFFEALTRVFFSEDLHKLYRARQGMVNGMEALTRSPAQRFEHFMNEAVGPLLEQRTHSRAVRRALDDKAVLRAFVEHHGALIKVFSKFANMHGPRRSSSRRQSGWSRPSVSSLARSNSRATRVMDLTGFLMVLQEAGLVFDENVAQGRSPERSEQKQAARSRSSIVLKSAHMQRQRHLRFTPLTFADARSLFAASQLENEDSEAISANGDAFSFVTASCSLLSGKEGTRASIGEEKLAIDDEANQDGTDDDFLSERESTAEDFARGARVTSTLEDLNYKEFVEVVVRVAFALPLSEEKATVTVVDKIQAVLGRLSDLLQLAR